MAEPSRRTQRKAELIVQSALLREKLAVEVLSMAQLPDMVSKGMNVWSKVGMLRRKPVWIGIFLLAFFVIKPRRVISGLVSAALLFKTWNRLKPLLIPIMGYLTRRDK